MTFEPPLRFNAWDYFLGDRLREGAGERTALITDSGSLTYADVAARAERFAALLSSRDVRPEERVLIALSDTEDWVAAFFGTLRHGSVVVMLNPHLKPEQIRYQLEYTRARAAFVSAESRPGFEEASADARHRPDLIEIGTDAFEAELAGAGPADDVFPAHRDDAAIWLYSGGTTGQPKAVVQSHRSFANTTELYAKGVLGMGPDDVTLSVPKLFFGYATGLNLLFPFAVGATATLFSGRCTTEALVEKLRERRPTILVNVPTMVNHLLSDDGVTAEDFASLRMATSAGEALPAELHRRWNELCGVPLLDGLGTAEMWHIFVTNRPGDVKPGSLGRVVEGFDLEVRDEDGAPLGPDEVGYLWVRGDSRAIGYWQQMEKTRDAFRGEWYVSGDMISMDAAGYVTYHGRGDDMLKVSGKWLSPQELENCLLEHTAVEEVAVVGVATDEGLVKPRAFVIPAADRPGNDALAAELQEWARTRLEPYKYPRDVIFMDDLPRTHLGKVDRGALARGVSGAP